MQSDLDTLIRAPAAIEDTEVMSSAFLYILIYIEYNRYYLSFIS